MAASKSALSGAKKGGAAEAVYFASAEKLREWLAKHHESESELWVGFYKVGTGRPSVTYKEAVDEVLCVGWIDGVRQSIDEERWRIRMTPRKPGSYWSEVNTKRANELIAEGRMTAVGLAEFERRDVEKTKEYSYEARTRGLDAPYEKRFKANKKAWAHFEAQPPGYRKTASWWVMSAKREETRWSRLETLFVESAQGKDLKALVRPGKG
jgi:uncharacterized protein YdeI (YjbR/CyaY-like superfamily)